LLLVEPKKDSIKRLVGFLNERKGQSGIILLPFQKAHGTDS